MKSLIGTQQLPGVDKKLGVNRVLREETIGHLEYALERGLYSCRAKNAWAKQTGRKKLHQLSRWTLAALVMARIAIRIEREFSMMTDKLSVSSFDRLLREQFSENWSVVEKQSFEWVGEKAEMVGRVALKQWIPELRTLMTEHHVLQDELKTKWLLARPDETHVAQ